MFGELGAALALAPARANRRTYQPVRRHSREAGKCEASFWRRMSKKEAWRILLAAKMFDGANKPKGKRSGPLGYVAIEVLEYLVNRMDATTGRLEPSLDTIMTKVRKSRGAVVRALDALRRHGFVDWLRRFVPLDNDGAGPQVQQTSNAYRLIMPAAGEAALGQHGGTPPLPEDRAQADAERAATIEEYSLAETIQPHQVELFEESSNPVMRSIGRLRRAMLKQRESTEETEHLSGSIYNRRE